MEATPENIRMIVKNFGMSLNSMAIAMSGELNGKNGKSGKNRNIYPGYLHGLGGRHANPTLDTLRRLSNVTGVTLTITPNLLPLEEVEE